MLNSLYHSIPIKTICCCFFSGIVFIGMKPFFSQHTHPDCHTPLHPFNGAEKNKAWVSLLPCACGQFIHYTHSFRYFPFHSIPLHYFVSFISLTSAPHSKSNSFFTFHKAITQAFRVMAFAYPSLHGFLCWNNLQKTATAQSKLLMPLQAT